MKRVLLAALAALAALAGCQSQKQLQEGAPIVDPGPLPAYGAVAEVYNRRVAGLDRLKTYTSVRFWVTDSEGKERTEVLDASLQIALPSRLSLRLDKVNSTYALLGSNAERYWWIELGKQPRALWGAHAAVSALRLAEIGDVGGLPVHPLDVIELLAVTALPVLDGQVGPGDDPGLAWSPDGRSLLVTAPSRGGQRRVWLDPKTFEPSKVELLGGEDEQGAVAWSELSKYVPLEPPSAKTPVIASQIMLHLPDARVEMRIANPENPGRRLKEQVFDFDYLLKQYRVSDVRSLDEPAPDAGH